MDDLLDSAQIPGLGAEQAADPFDVAGHEAVREPHHRQHDEGVTRGHAGDQPFGEHVDLNKTRDDASVRTIADGIHRAIVDVYGIPLRDCFQIITKHEPGEIIAEDAGLGFERTDGLAMIHMFAQSGRTPEVKQALCAKIAENLAAVGVAGELAVPKR